MAGEVLVLVEQSGGKAVDVSLEALTFARAFGGPVHALVIRSLVDLGAYGVRVTHVAEHEALDAFAPEAWAAIAGQLADRLGARAVMAAGTDRGNEVMARVAARAGLPLAANCTAATQGPPLTVTRLRWGGSLLEEARMHSPRPLITVAPHVVTVEQAPVANEVDRFTPQLKE